MMKWIKHLCVGQSATVTAAPGRDRIEDIHCVLDNEELTAENSRKLRSKRFAKKQQMQWTKKSAHLVLQMRTQVLDERLEETFRDWYPDFRTKRLKHPLFMLSTLTQSTFSGLFGLVLLVVAKAI